MSDTLASPPTLELVRARRDEILRLAGRRGARNLRVFGSVARGEAGPDSDIDIMAEWRDDTSMFDMVGLWLDLEELLGRPVNLADADALKDHVRASALRDAVPL